MFGGRKHRNKFNFLSESELGCGPQDSIGNFTFIAILRELTEMNAEKLKKARISFW